MFRWINQKTLMLSFGFLILVLGFQNCSESENQGDASVAASTGVESVVVDMKYNGGPGVYEGAKVELTSQVDADDYYLQWYHQADNQAHGFPLTNQNQAELILENIELVNDGVYWLAVTDGDGEMVISNKVDIEVKPSQLKTQPSNAVAKQSGRAEFLAEVRNGSDVSYTWQWKKTRNAEF